jgi:hypothetical protein
VKTIAVILRTTGDERTAEAIRAAVGLTLRGDRVVVDLGAAPTGDQRVRYGIATLRVLGHTIASDVGEAIRDADAVEVWT